MRIRHAVTWSIGCLSVSIFWGCFGFAKGNVEYRPRSSTWTTKTQVRAALGEPVRVATESDLEVWYYLVQFNRDFPSDPNVPGERQTETFASAAFVMPVFWWTTELSENVKITFKGETVVGAYELRKAEGTGAVCGLLFAHVTTVGCTNE